MSVAQVVPLRRFPPKHQWFDYRVPAELDVQPGQLVAVPFLRQDVPGIVWSVSETSVIPRLKNINRILRPEIIMTTWQRRVCDVMAEQSFVSRGHIIDSVVPQYPRKMVQPRLTADHVTKIHIPSQPPPMSSTWWYRTRAEAESWIQFWLTQKTSVPRLLIVPTVEDGQRLRAIVQNEIPTIAFVHSLLPRPMYRHVYEGVRMGTITQIIGTAQGLTLPWPSPPEILLDQEEHPAHKQTAQQPRTDVRRVLEAVTATLTVTTPAPSLRWWFRQHPEPPPPLPHDRRQIVSLQQAKRTPWLSAELDQLITEALAERRQVLLIAPQHGYASSISCRDCSLSLACQQCHQRLRLKRQTQNSVACSWCGQAQSIPATCPRCGGAHWSWHGWGVDHLAETMKRLWPRARISTIDPDADTDIAIDTYRGYRSVEKLQRLKSVVVVSGDSLLNFPDFSVAERAWQFLARLQAAAPAVPVLVQTFSADSDFWQRWRHSADQTWYDTELEARRHHNLPPIADQWIAYYPGRAVPKVVQEMVVTLEKLDLPDLSVSVLPAKNRQVTNLNRILLTSLGRPLDDLLHIQEVFPYPWQIDTSVQSWLS